MSADMGKEPCAACGKAGDRELTVWEHVLCLPCVKAWDAVAPDHLERPDYVRFTTDWVTKRRTEAA